MFILKNSTGKSLPEKCIALLHNYYCSGQKKGPIGMEYNFFFELSYFLFNSNVNAFFLAKWSVFQHELLLSQYIKLAFFLKGKRGINLKFEDGHNLYLTLCIFSPFWIDWLLILQVVFQQITSICYGFQGILDYCKTGARGSSCQLAAVISWPGIAFYL